MTRSGGNGLENAKIIGVLPWRALGRAISRRIAPAYSTGTDTFPGVRHFGPEGTEEFSNVLNDFFRGLEKQTGVW